MQHRKTAAVMKMLPSGFLFVLHAEYPKLANPPIKMLMSFAAAYLHLNEFSALTSMKRKQREQTMSRKRAVVEVPVKYKIYWPLCLIYLNVVYIKCLHLS